MQLDDGDYWRDGVVMMLIDSVNSTAATFAVMEAESGEEFNAAIWAATILSDIVSAHYGPRDAHATS